MSDNSVGEDCVYQAKVCEQCGMDNPDDLALCVKCRAKLPSLAEGSRENMSPGELPKMATSEEVDFDKDGMTYVALVFMNSKEEWFRLSRKERVEIIRTHAKGLAPYANKVALNFLIGLGLSKYDYIEEIEADDLKIVHSLVRSLRFGALGRYVEIVEVLVTIKGQYHFVG
ncbi:MAG: chlorite dismutase family protein [Planctomycetota bacterium]